MKEYKLKINGNMYQVAVEGIENNIAEVSVNGISYSVEIGDGKTSDISEKSKSVIKEETVAVGNNNPAGGKTVKSPLPGVILSIDVKEGEEVRRGKKLAVIEAMKMENEILSECDGIIKKVHVSKGDSVLEGAKILDIE